MIYVDSSVALAHLFAEDRTPPAPFWNQSLVSSRLLEYEMWTRIHARGLGRSHGDDAQEFLDCVSLVEMSPAVLERALDPFPMPVRTLDAIHLASAEFLRSHGQPVEFASYDERQLAAAAALGIPRFAL